MKNKVYYGIRCYSTMCGTEFYIIEDSKEKVEKAFKTFLDYLFEGDENWVDYTLNSNKVFNSDDSTIDYMVGTLDNGNNVIIVDNYYDGTKAFEFELVKNYVERF